MALGIGILLFLIGSSLLQCKKLPDWLSFIAIGVFPLWVILESFIEFRNQPWPSFLVLFGVGLMIFAAFSHY